MNALAENTLSQLQNPQVRDLAWACFSPALLHCSQVVTDSSLQDCHFPLNAWRLCWLQELDGEPEPLLQHLSGNRHNRLGLYFEALWQFFLEQDPDVELLAHNLPVRDGGNTLGEFDLIYFCHQRDRHVHLELALKFYLCAADSQGSAWNHWLGPNSRDRLDLKLERLLEHQTRLAEIPEARRQLAGLGIVEPLREVHIKGRLYRHFRHEVKPPPGYNRALPLQQWAHLHSAGEAAGSSETRLLAREQWLAPLGRQSARCTGPMPPPAQQHEPRQLARMDKRGRECGRIFLVPDHWPEPTPGVAAG